MITHHHPRVRSRNRTPASLSLLTNTNEQTPSHRRVPEMPVYRSAIPAEQYLPLPERKWNVSPKDAERQPTIFSIPSTEHLLFHAYSGQPPFADPCKTPSHLVSYSIDSHHDIHRRRYNVNSCARNGPNSFLQCLDPPMSLQGRVHSPKQYIRFLLPLPVHTSMLLGSVCVKNMLGRSVAMVLGLGHRFHLQKQSICFCSF